MLFRSCSAAISGAALAALDDLAAEHGISDRVRDRARREGYERLELANARAVARQRAIEERDLAELDASFDDASSTGPVPPDGPDLDQRRTESAPQGTDDDGTAFTGPLQMIAVSDDIDVTQRSPLLRHKEAQRLRLAVLERKREVLLRLRREGTIDDLIARKILAGLDLEEIRARGIEKASD